MEYKERITKRIEEIVFYENKSRTILNELVPKLKAVLKEYEGQQVLKVNHEMMAKLRTKLGKVIHEYEEGIRAWFRCWKYSISLVLNIRYNSENDGWNYYETEIYLCSVDNLILKQISEENIREMLKPEEETEQYFKVEALKEQLQKEETKLFYKVRKL